MMFSTQSCYYIKKFTKIYEHNFEKCATFLINKAIKKAYVNQELDEFKIKNRKVEYDDVTVIIALLKQDGN